MAKQFMTIDNLTLYDTLLKSKIATDISTAEARSLHTVAIDGTTLKFYREEEPVGSATPAYSISLPQQDLSNFLQKIAGATGGKIVVSKADGTIEESNNSISDFALASSLSAVATSGEAEDVTYDNTSSGLASSDVQSAIDELAGQSAGGVASKTVYITETAGGASDLYSKRYGIYQGATGSTQSPVVGEKLVDIDIPKDMVVESGSVGTVTTADVPYEGAEVGDKYIDLVLANSASTHIYIPANSLVDVYTAQQSATQIQLAIDANNVISATVVAGSIGTTELAGLAVTTAKIADDAVTTAKILDANVTADKLASNAVTTAKIADDAVTADKVAISAHTESQTAGTDGLAISVTTTDGQVSAVSGSIASNTYDAYGSASTVQSALTGSSSDTKTDLTLYGLRAYADDVAGDATEAIPENSIRALFE